MPFDWLSSLPIAKWEAENRRYTNIFKFECVFVNTLYQSTKLTTGIILKEFKN